jgi:hypothetical protein
MCFGKMSVISIEQNVCFSVLLKRETHANYCLSAFKFEMISFQDKKKKSRKGGKKKILM